MSQLAFCFLWRKCPFSPCNYRMYHSNLEISTWHCWPVLLSLAFSQKSIALSLQQHFDCFLLWFLYTTTHSNLMQFYTRHKEPRTWMLKSCRGTEQRKWCLSPVPQSHGMKLFAKVKCIIVEVSVICCWTFGKKLMVKKIIILIWGQKANFLSSDDRK